jgi:hypothetical protein
LLLLRNEVFCREVVKKCVAQPGASRSRVPR